MCDALVRGFMGHRGLFGHGYARDIAFAENSPQKKKRMEDTFAPFLVVALKSRYSYCFFPLVSISIEPDPCLR